MDRVTRIQNQIQDLTKRVAVIRAKMPEIQKELSRTGALIGKVNSKFWAYEDASVLSLVGEAAGMRPATFPAIAKATRDDKKEFKDWADTICRGVRAAHNVNLFAWREARASIQDLFHARRGLLRTIRR